MTLANALTLDDYEGAYATAVDAAVRAYVDGGAGSETTVRGNSAAYDDVWLIPRLPTSNCTMPTLERTLFGKRVAMPIVLAPTSPQRLLCDEAELATARAAVAAGIITVVSTDSHYAFPDIATVAPDHCWFQLYAYRSRRDVSAAIRLAEDAGARALVVTVDAVHAARRIRARRAGFVAPAGVDFGTLRSLGILEGPVPSDARLERLPLSWDDLSWIRDCTVLPLVVKGVVDPLDARRCVDCGVDGIVVSNHGGRQLDGVLPTLEALEPIANAVGGSCTVFLDGGIRSGVAIVKALALGADAVCVGRPYLWGLAIGGEAGVTDVLGILRRELEDTLLQMGLAGVDEVTRDRVVRRGASVASSDPAIPVAG